MIHSLGKVAKAARNLLESTAKQRLNAATPRADRFYTDGDDSIYTAALAYKCV